MTEPQTLSEFVQTIPPVSELTKRLDALHAEREMIAKVLVLARKKEKLGSVKREAVPCS